MTQKKILQLLSDGAFHSGEELGIELGVSRAAVWKQLQRLAELGLEVDSVKGRGYRLVGGVDLLDSGQIKSQLSDTASALLSELDVQELVSSTNEIALASLKRGYVCTAEQQSSGKGRRGRKWVSPYARNVYLSLVWDFSGGAAALEGLSLAVGVCVVRALTSLGVEGVCLKWPNDLVFESRKLGGVLLEMSGDAAGYCQVVVGVGLNVDMQGDQPEIDQPWISLKELCSKPPSRNRLMAEMINELLPMLSHYEKQGFSAYKSAWEEMDAYRDSEITMVLGDQRVPGIAKGVDSTGALLLDCGAGIRSFSGGEVSLRVSQ